MTHRHECSTIAYTMRRFIQNYEYLYINDIIIIVIHNYSNALFL